jgi:hypothetical protein
MATNGTAPPAQQQMVDQKDVNDWIARFNGALADTKTVTGPAEMDARPWSESFFGCFSPIDTCTLFCTRTLRRKLTNLGAITCCVPCITFGKTHHRVRKHGQMEGYNCVNASVSSV